MVFSRKALVLGDRGVADRIADSLREAGAAAERVPAPATLDGLRNLLRRFAEQLDGKTRGLVHPGVGAWAERPELLAVGQDLGLGVLAPPARAMTVFSNKLQFLGEAERLNIPNLVLSFDPLRSPREVEQLMGKGGWNFPFVLKAARSGEGFGRYVVREAADLEQKLSLWIEQLRLSSGEALLFAEKYIEGARYVTLPFARFTNPRRGAVDGSFVTFPLCDSSLQSRFRKVVEFCPFLGIDAPVEARLREWTELIARTSGYVGVGVLEFVVDGPRAHLVEGLGRLNTNFHLWESVAGISAVAWQLAALTSEAPPPPKPDPEWAAGIALRFHAEDSLLQLPQPGLIYELGDEREWSFPEAVAELDLTRDVGESVEPSDSAQLGFLWVGGSDANRALKVARGVLDELWIAGSLQTNERFLSELINHPWVKAGIFHAGFVDEEFLPSIRPPVEFLEILAGLGIAAAGPLETVETVRWSVGDQWVKLTDRVTQLDWASGPARFEAEGQPGVSGTVRLVDGRSLRVCAYPIAPDRWQARAGSWSMVVRRSVGKTGANARMASKPRISALISGRVHSILFREGSEVPAHEAFLIIESLGILVPHALPKAVRVIRWKVRAEDQVKAGEELADFELVER